MSTQKERTARVLLLLAGAATGFAAGFFLAGSIGDPRFRDGSPGTIDAIRPCMTDTGTTSEVKVECSRLRDRNRKLLAEITTLKNAASSGPSGDAEEGTQASLPDKYQEIPWPTDIPEGYGPDEFEGVFKKALGEADNGLEVVSLECDEPPCMALVRLPMVGGGLSNPLEDYWNKYAEPLKQSQTWKKHFGEGISWNGKIGSCGDGRTELAAFVWSVPDDWDEGFVDKIGLRADIRQEDMLDAYECRPRQ